jgi:mono/diheme cytochrome c family protein
MKMIETQISIVVTVLAVVLSVAPSASAQNGEALFKTKCAVGHGVAPRKVSDHNLQGPDVQKMSDAEISEIITNGRGKMPPPKALKPEYLLELVTYVRTLKK